MINITYAIQLTGDVIVRPVLTVGGDVSVGRGVGVTGNIMTYVMPKYYDGLYNIIPTKSERVLNTENLLMASNVTIKPIPDVYIDTTLENGALPGQILNGRAAFANGELVQGTAALATATYDGEGITLTNGFPVEVGNG